MRLLGARIRNFRSIKELSVRFGAHTAIIGGNGAGKSSILKAIERFYSTAKSLDPDDFFGRDQTQPVEIEMTFGELTELELQAFGSRVREGQLVVTRVFDSAGNSGRYFGSVLANPDFLPIRQAAGANPKREAYRLLRTGNDRYVDLPNAGSAAAVDEALREWEEAHPDQLTLQRDDGQFFGFQNAGRGALQRYTAFLFVPAVREASVDAADGKASAIGQLLELIVRSAILQRSDIIQFRNEMTARYRDLVSPENMPELEALATTLTGDLQGLYADAGVGLSWRQVADLPVPLPLADVALTHDGFGGPVDRQGHGLQRAFVFTLLQHLARTSTANAQREDNDGAGDIDGAEELPIPVPSLILAIEEPELYQHPTKQRHFAEVLRALSGGTLPGAHGPTQIIFASHSPMFVSLAKADEIRLARRTSGEEGEYKRCALNALDLAAVASRLEVAWQKPTGSYSASTLMPRLHILGSELAEGFFAAGVVLVEGRSDKAALIAMARLMGLSFEAAGIAVLSAEGKENLDRPFVIFDELRIPTFMMWDCDGEAKGSKADSNLALARLSMPAAGIVEVAATTAVAECHAHFEVNLERTMRDEIGADNLLKHLSAACEPFGIAPSKDAQKIPEVMFQTLSYAHAAGAECKSIRAVIRAIWLHLRGEVIA